MTITISVRNDNVENALRILNKKLQIEGIFKIVRRKRFHESSYERKKRKKDESLKRRKKNNLFISKKNTNTLKYK